MRYLALYLLTCEHRTTEGIFRLPKAYIMGDLGWDMNRIEKAFDGLVKEGFISYDDQAQVVLLRKALKWQKPETTNHMKAAVKALRNLPETRLWQEFLVICKDLAPGFYEYIAQHIPDRINDAISDGISDDITNGIANDIRDSIGDDIRHTPYSILHDDDNNARAREGEQWSEFRQVFAEAYGGLPNSAHYEEIDGFLADGMSLDAVIEAVRRAALNKAKGWSYVRRILQNWLKDGLLTVEQIHEHEERRQTRTRASPPSPPQDGLPSWIDQELEKYRRIVEEQRRAKEAETA